MYFSIQRAEAVSLFGYARLSNSQSFTIKTAAQTMFVLQFNMNRKKPEMRTRDKNIT